MSNQYLTVNSQPSQVASSAPVAANLHNTLTDIRYFIEGFLLKQRSQRHSPRTTEFYKYNLDKFVWWLEHEGLSTALHEITPNTIRLFLIYLQESKQRWGSERTLANRPLSESAVHAFARSLRAFFKWASKEARLHNNPFDNVDMPHLSNVWKVQTFSEDEIVHIFQACDMGGDAFTNQRNRTIVALLLDTGIRASELLRLTVSDINPQVSTFQVLGKGNKQRTVVAGGAARREVWLYLVHYRLRMEPPSDALFVSRTGAPLSYSGLQQVMQDLGQRAGINRISVHAHIFRHTAASQMHRNGMSGATIQEILGHTDYNITRKFYIDVSKGDIIAEHSRYSPLDTINRQVTGSTSKERSERIRPALPPASVLKKEIEASNYRAVARKYQCSDTCLRKRLRKAGLLP